MYENNVYMVGIGLMGKIFLYRTKKEIFIYSIFGYTKDTRKDLQYDTTVWQRILHVRLY